MPKPAKKREEKLILKKQEPNLVKNEFLPIVNSQQ